MYADIIGHMLTVTPSAAEQSNSAEPPTRSIATEPQDLKTRTRKLQLEIEEKNEIINVLKDELETLREQSDKYQRENIQLVKDAKRVKFLQDENDFLQDKVGAVEKLENEIKRLKEKLNEVEFFKIRTKELEEDLTKAQSESADFERKLQEAEGKLTRVPELEAELTKWKLFSNEVEQEKSSIELKLLESIDNESKLNSVNKKVEDEVERLRDIIKSYEEKHDEEQASNSLILSMEPDIDVIKSQEHRLNELASDNERIRDELESNRNLISNLRQDLACEKSLAQKLTSQLAIFTKQIRNMDEQYLPIHDTSPKTNSSSTWLKKDSTNSQAIVSAELPPTRNLNHTDDARPQASSSGGQSIHPAQFNQLAKPVEQQQAFSGRRQYAPAPQLTDQQVAHLNNLHREHYLHHLEQLHRMHHQHHLHHMHHMNQKCAQQQQPTMRTSKILNIGQLVNNGQTALVANKTNGDVDGLSRLSSNLANIKLNDNLAFSSLRVPKKSSSGVNLKNAFILEQSATRHRVGAYENGDKNMNSFSSPTNRLRSTSGGPKSNNSPTNGTANGNTSNNNNNNNNSSVWFEYGCI